MYYLQSRYYDAETGRFVNADAYIKTGQDVLDGNMYAYCGNNPVNRVDPSGCFLQEIWELFQTTVVEIGKAIRSMAPAYAGCGSLALADGPLPFGDIAGGVGTLIITAGAVGIGSFNAASDKIKEKSKAKPENKPKGEAKPSNKPYKNNKEANKQAQKQGYKDAHDLKEDYVGKNDIAKYDMKYDTKTGEIYLESKDGKIQIPTGLIHEP